MFSVVMPIHNKKPHLARSIESVLNQTFKEFELILIDDASTDGSKEVIESYEDSRIKVFYRTEPGPGGYAARNLGIRMAKYDWISFLDADDCWELNFLESFADAIIHNPRCNFFSAKWDNIYSDRVVENTYFDRFTDKYVKFDVTDFLNHNFFVWTSATTINKGLLVEAGMFPENRCKRGGDMDAWIRCLSINNENIWINVKLAHYYKETVNQVTSNNRNPVLEICALPTLELLRHNSRDQNLHEAIDTFLAKIFYNKMISDYRRFKKKPVFHDLKTIKRLKKRLYIFVKANLRILFLEKTTSN